MDLVPCCPVTISRSTRRLCPTHHARLGLRYAIETPHSYGCSPFLCPIESPTTCWARNMSCLLRLKSSQRATSSLVSSVPNLNNVKARSRWRSSHTSPSASDHGGLPKVTRSTNPSTKSRIENDRMMKKAKVTNSTGESYDSTTFFRFANPELFLDPKKKSTWNIVGAVWVCCFAGLGYKYYEDYYKVERKPSGVHGPVKPDGSWK